MSNALHTSLQHKAVEQAALDCVQWLQGTVWCLWGKASAADTPSLPKQEDNVRGMENAD